MNDLELPTLAELQAAANLLHERRISSTLIRDAESGVFMKLECQLPGGSYKIRGVENFVKQLPEHIDKVQVLSAGNLALAAALCLGEMGRHCEALVPQGISTAKRQGLEQAGASITERDFAEIWSIVHDDRLRQSQSFMHPFHRALLAGYASIIPELNEMGVRRGMVIVPYGLGGLAAALARAIELLQLDLQLVLCEITDAAPFSRAVHAGTPVSGNRLRSFIEAMGTPAVIPDVFAYLKTRVAKVITVTEQEVKNAIRSAFLTHGLRLEGAAGACYAAAGKLGELQIPLIAILTGANISEDIFCNIRQEQDC